MHPTTEQVDNLVHNYASLFLPFRNYDEDSLRLRRSAVRESLKECKRKLEKAYEVENGKTAMIIRANLIKIEQVLDKYQ